MLLHHHATPHEMLLKLANLKKKTSSAEMLKSYNSIYDQSQTKTNSEAGSPPIWSLLLRDNEDFPFTLHLK